ncbi:MAG: hypothetical protein JSS31_06960 [Proteobacteria bacterium]|nr:hypothetical protein [Pseudomonadota bacterium]MBS0493689.1 hypothetical protein [Pseudomonadota bacterium]
MSTSNIRRLAGRIGSAALLALAASCAPLQPETGPGAPPWIGRITSIEGRNAFVDPGNSGAARPAQNGQTLLAGDRFYTGPGTRMKIEFRSGGAIELDENTDPSLFQDLGCLVVSLFRSGRIFVDKSDACIESLGTKSQQFSKVVYAVMPAGPYVQITVVEGKARTLQPAIAEAPANWRIDVNSRAILAGGKPYQVSEETVRQSIEWTLYYRNRTTSSTTRDVPIFFNFGFPQRSRYPNDRDTGSRGNSR